MEGIISWYHSILCNVFAYIFPLYAPNYYSFLPFRSGNGANAQVRSLVKGGVAVVPDSEIPALPLRMLLPHGRSRSGFGLYSDISILCFGQLLGCFISVFSVVLKYWEVLPSTFFWWEGQLPDWGLHPCTEQKHRPKMLLA